MSLTPLFLDKSLEFEKVAGMLTRLGDNTENWPQEIVQEAYKRLPYLSNFEVNVVLDRVDEERGYAFGSIEVRPISSMPEEQRSTELGSVHIPVVVKNQMMSPLDIFLYGERYNYLTESRLRSVLFRSETFDSPQMRPPDATFGGDLMPPATSGGFGSIGVKLGSAMVRNLPILPQLNGRILEEHALRLKQAMQDPSIKTACINAHDGVQAAIASAMRLSATDVTKTAAILTEHIRPDVVQIVKTPTGEYMVKWANADMYSPQQEQVPQQAAQQLVGNGQLGQQLEQQGNVTANPQATVDQAMENTDVRLADQFGLWAVQDTLGNELVGWVFPHVLSLDQAPLPMTMFTNGSQYAIQDGVVGKFLSKATDLPRRPPQGYGSLYVVDGGTATAMLPMTVTNTFTDPMGTVNYMAKTDLGDMVSFYFSPMVKAPARVGDGQLIVPSHYKWLPLKAKVDLVADATLFAKTANKKWTSTVELIGDGTQFSYEGPAVAKLASSQTKFIDPLQTEFLGLLMGINKGFMKTAMARAQSGARVTITGLRTITPLQEKMAEAREKVLKELNSLEHPIRNYFLLKEAAILDDALTADKILGLGFINAENIATFIDMIPGLEEASSKLAELLLAVRLGRPEVPEVAVERMLAALEDVLHGLRTLRQKEIRFRDQQ